jgi:two-component system, cell cycle sensor histidine kinase and response regulator CckA
MIGGTALIVSVLTIFGSSKLRRYSDDHHQARALLAQIEAEAYQQSAAEWRAEAEREVSREVMESIRESRDATQDALTALEITTGERDGASSVRPILGRYKAAIDEELDLIRRGQFEAARGVDANIVDPTFEGLQTEIKTLSTKFEVNSERASLVAELGTAVILLGAIAALVLLYFRYAKLVSVIAAAKAADKVSTAANARFLSVAQAASDAIVGADARGAITSWNQGAEIMFGYSAESIIGRSLTSLLPERYSERFGPGLKEEANVKEGSVNSATVAGIEGLRRDGAEFPVELSLSSWEDGGSVSYSIVIRDTTERKRLEAQLRQAAKMEAVGQLAGGVAHDFNNLLTVINCHVEMLREDSKDSPTQLEDINEIGEAAKRAESLTRQLLGFSRKQIQQPKVLDLNESIKGMEKMLRRLVTEDIDLVVKPMPIAAHVCADPGQLDQLLMNLVVNASDAMPQGGTLTVEVTRVELEEPYFRERGVRPVVGSYVGLFVSDTGVGMDTGTQSRIFEPFFTTKGVGKGTGLGLATVYGIVKQSGGFIWVYSEVGHGTTFKVYLPHVAAAASEEITRDEKSPVAPGGETLLVVEDDDAIRAMMRRTLKRDGYIVLDATDGQNALDLASTYDKPIDLLLTDVVMPFIGGRELAERLLVTRPAMKIVYMSGYTDDVVLRRGLLGAGVTFIQKPFAPAALVAKLRNTLDNPN